jgi:hypothetical protein
MNLRRFRFGIRSLLVTVALLGIIGAAWSVGRAPYMRQWAAVHDIQGDDDAESIPSNAAALKDGRIRFANLEIRIRNNESPFLGILYPDHQVSLISEVKVDGDIKCARFFQHIAAFPFLQSADVNASNISDENIARFASAEHLEELSISADNLTGSGFEALASLERLKGIKLRSQGLSTRGVQAISNLEHLEHLTLRFSDKSDGRVDFATLGQSTSLRSVQLEGRFPRSIYQALGVLPQLDSLIIESDELTDSDIALLARSSSLWSLLANGPLTDQCLPALIQCSALRDVSLMNTNITDEGIEYLSRMRPDITVDSYRSPTRQLATPIIIDPIARQEASTTLDAFARRPTPVPTSSAKTTPRRAAR